MNRLIELSQKAWTANDGDVTAETIVVLADAINEELSKERWIIKLNICRLAQQDAMVMAALTIAFVNREHFKLGKDRPNGGKTGWQRVQDAVIRYVDKLVERHDGCSHHECNEEASK